jgi:hypothetical protein
LKYKEIDQLSPEALSEWMGTDIFLIKDWKYYPSIPFEGNNAYRYLNIFFIDESDKHIPDEFRDLFFKMHRVVSKKGITMDLQGMAIVNLNHCRQVSFANLLEVFNPKYISFWGVNPAVFKLKIEPMMGAKINQIKMLRFPSYRVLLTDSAKVEKCESNLKFMFGI